MRSKEHEVKANRTVAFSKLRFLLSEDKMPPPGVLIHLPSRLSPTPPPPPPPPPPPELKVSDSSLSKKIKKKTSFYFPSRTKSHTVDYLHGALPGCFKIIKFS